jgi:hypothetical protein
VKFSAAVFSFLFAVNAFAQSIFDQAIANTPDYRIQNLESKIESITGNSLRDLATRTQLQSEVTVLKQEKARRILSQAIEGTDMSAMASDNAVIERSRLSPRKKDLGSATLNQVVDNTVAANNPAVAGKQIPEGRPLVLYRDVDPADLFTAKEFGKGEERVIVYKSKDLSGRPVYKTLDGKVSNAIVQSKLMPHEEVLYQDVNGNLQKGYPKAIYPDGTLEIKEQNGATTRRAAGTYHLTDDVKSVSKNSVNTYSGKSASPYQDLNAAGLSAKEKKALEALKRALCNM